MSQAFRQKQENLALALEKTQSVLLYADEKQFIPLSSHAFVLAQQVAEGLRGSDLTARAHLSMFETMGLSAQEIKGLQVQLAMKVHWSQPPGASFADEQLERKNWERLVLTPVGLQGSLRLLHPLELPENCVHWGILRPYVQEVLRSAKDLLKESKIFANTISMPKILHWAPFFGAHLLSYDKSYKIHRPYQNQTIENPTPSTPMHLIGLVSQVMHLSYCAFELTQDRANYEEQSAAKSIFEQIEGPSVWSSAIEFLELEKIIAPAKSNASLVPALGWSGRHPSNRL